MFIWVLYINHDTFSQILKKKQIIHTRQNVSIHDPATSKEKGYLSIILLWCWFLPLTYELRNQPVTFCHEKDFIAKTKRLFFKDIAQNWKSYTLTKWKNIWPCSSTIPQNFNWVFFQVERSYDIKFHFQWLKTLGNNFYTYGKILININFQWIGLQRVIVFYGPLSICTKNSCILCYGCPYTTYTYVHTMYAW